jgi:murein DD-endopeptidase MepM/ murein hydrolase activator NlpD
MTVPQERDDDPFVFDILGFGTPASLEPVAGPAEPVHPFSPSREVVARDVVSAPLTRRELRDRERTSDDVPAPRRSAPTARAKMRTKPRRMAKNTSRRDAVRVAGATKKTVGKRLLSFGAMLFAGALAFGLTVPANAFDTTDEQVLADSLAMESQSVEVDPTLVSFSERDAWSVTSWAEMLRLKYGNRTFEYNPGTGPIRWPFPYAVPISSGFGDRAAPCRGCSTSHSGVDFAPGAGAAIFAVADGVVLEHSASGTSWGHYVVLQHEIDGQVVYSGYAHMQADSSPLNVGDEIKVGDFIGLVGATGQATGAHLHFTISVDQRMNYIDPFAWLKAHAS